MTRLSDHLTRHLLPPSLPALLDWEAVCASHRALRPALLLACLLLIVAALNGLQRPVRAGLEHLTPAPVHAVHQSRV